MRIVALTLCLACACKFDPGAGVDGASPPTDDSMGAGDAIHNDAPNLDDGPATTDGTPACENGALDSGELDVDCGGTCPNACTRIFTPDGSTLAIFELGGDFADGSGNGRNATSIGGTFVPTSWGMGLSMSGVSTQGFQWNAFASMIVHPYTVEIVVTPRTLGSFGKLFGFSDSNDNGWYYRNSRFNAYPNGSLGNALTANQRHYFAIVSTSSSQVDVYLNGAKIGSIGASFTAPPSSAIFFRDDTFTSRNEALDGIVDGVRISSVARSSTEIAAVQTKLSAQP